MSVYKVWYAGKNPDYFEFVESPLAVEAAEKFVTKIYDKERFQKESECSRIAETTHELYVQLCNVEGAKVHGIIVKSEQRTVFVGHVQKTSCLEEHG